MYVEIVLRDANNGALSLSGASFVRAEGTVENGRFQASDRAQIWTGSTDAAGTLRFGKDAGIQIKYNTVYQIRETAAPGGYAMDPVPGYFVIAQADGNGKCPKYPKGVEVIRDVSDTYEYRVFNARKEENLVQIVGGPETELSNATSGGSLVSIKQVRPDAYLLEPAAAAPLAALPLLLAFLIYRMVRYRRKRQ